MRQKTFLGILGLALTCSGRAGAQDVGREFEPLVAGAVRTARRELKTLAAQAFPPLYSGKINGASGAQAVALSIESRVEALGYAPGFRYWYWITNRGEVEIKLGFSREHAGDPVGQILSKSTALVRPGEIYGIGFLSAAEPVKKPFEIEAGARGLDGSFQDAKLDKEAELYLADGLSPFKEILNGLVEPYTQPKDAE